jgi:hypothetical protein
MLCYTSVGQAHSRPCCWHHSLLLQLACKTYLRRAALMLHYTLEVPGCASLGESYLFVSAAPCTPHSMPAVRQGAQGIHGTEGTPR